MIAALLVLIICILVAAFFPGLGSALLAIVIIGGLFLFVGLPTSGAFIFSVIFGTLLVALCILPVVWPDIKKSREQKRLSALYPPVVIPDSEVIPKLWELFRSGKLTQKTHDLYWSHFPDADPSEKVYYAYFHDPEQYSPDGSENGFITYAIRDGQAVFVNPTDEHIAREIFARTIKPNELFKPPSPLPTATAAD